MIGGSRNCEYSPRDIEYLRDLGLIAPSGPIAMANPIYAEVIPRELTVAQESELETLVFPHWYVRPDGALDLPKLLSAFQAYFREDSDAWIDRSEHREAGPQLVLQSYFPRAVNSGGRITREYAVARGRSDLVIEWPPPGRTLASGAVKHVIECKVGGDKSGLEAVIAKGKLQTAGYMDACSAARGHFVVFDMRSGRSREARIFRRDPRPDKVRITVWGM